MNKVLLSLAKTAISTVLLFVGGSMVNDGFTFSTLKNPDFWKAAGAASVMASWKKYEDSPKPQAK